MLVVAKEIAWRKARFGWHYECGHLPSEVNTISDDLSRLSGPDAVPVPEVLRGVQWIQPPAPGSLWQLPH